LDFCPALLASLLVLPVIVWDLLRLSHRFVGPMIRLRNAMRDLADGKQVRPISFREEDFWCEFAEEFNRLAARLEATSPVAESEHSPTVEPEEAVAV
jgi:signal transduction histidine kinase